MSDRFAVRHAELAAHARTVEAIGDQVTGAADAGRTARPGPEAYGRLCLMVPAMLAALQDVLVDGMTSTADALHDTAIRLRTTAADYEQTDGRRAQAFGDIRARP